MISLYVKFSVHSNNAKKDSAKSRGQKDERIKKGIRQNSAEA